MLSTLNLLTCDQEIYVVPGVGGNLMTPLKEIPEDLPMRSLAVRAVEGPVRSRGIRGISVGLFFLA